MDIRSITAVEARSLRAPVLRPGRPLQDSIYATDDAPETLHLGAYLGGELVSVATIFPEPMPGEDDERAWRLRGMATRPGMRRQGYGRAVLERCIEHVAAQGGTLFWCNARTDAIEFYRTLGFERRGGEQKTARGTSFVRMLRRTTLPSGLNQEQPA